MGVDKYTEELIHAAAEQAADRAVEKALIRFGLDTSDPLASQADFVHLRAWRQRCEKIQSQGFVTFVAVAVAAVLGLLWTGFKGSLGFGAE